jgi:protoporphyrinogen oxidase
MRKIRVSGFRDMLKKDTKLYFGSFYYPDRGGYGAISQRLYHGVAEHVHLETKVTAVRQEITGGKTTYTCTFEKHNGERFSREFDVLVSTLPLNVFSGLFGLNINLTFRPAKVVYLYVNKANLTGMHWFYVADAGYMINRVAEFKNFSRDHDAEGGTVICVEVTAQENFSRDKVISELEGIGVLRAADVMDTKVVDIPCAYPVYDLNYAEQRARAHGYFEKYPNIYLLGRNAQFSHVDVDEIFSAARGMASDIVAELIGQPD